VSGNNSTNGGFQEFEKRRTELLELIDELAPIVSGIEVASCAETLGRIRDRTESDTFKVIVVGEFKRGKSTFINALLGERVLPTHSLPCTAIINEVKWSTERKALLHPMPGRGDSPIEIPIDELTKHVTIKNGEETDSSPYSRAEVFWPLPLCRNRVEIIDSPGLNEAPEREAITLGYLDLADAMIVVMLATSPVSLNEQTFLDVQVTARGHNDAFFIFNRINDIEMNEREETVRGIRRRLSSYSNRENRIFFVDARSGLTSRMSGDVAGFETSGVAAVEAELELFLTRERGRTKLLVPAQHLKSVVSEARRNLTLQQGMLRQSADDLRRSFEEVREPLHRLERERILILKRVDNHLAETVRQVEFGARNFYRRIASDVETWVGELDIEKRLSGFKNLNPVGLRQRAEALQTDVSERLSARLQVEYATWHERELRTLLEHRMSELETDIGHDLQQVIAAADAIRYSLAAVPPPPTQPGISNATERVAAAGAGLVLGGPGMALVGANLGFQGVVKAILPAVGVAVIGVVFGWAALPVFAAMAATGAVQASWLMDGVEKKLKQEVARGYSDHIRANLDAMVDELSTQVNQQLTSVREIIGRGIEADLKSVQQEAEAALRKRESGEKSTNAALAELITFSAQVDDIDDRLTEFITSVAMK
jgi:ABC-type multidrug transport system fused ATPase/permease subunit